MSDAARKLLDSLMGQTRDADLSEVKQNRGKNFLKDDVCKHYLLGFCPLVELSEGISKTKRKVQTCRKVHSDAMKAEFEQHPEKAKYKAEYESSMMALCESLVREADNLARREKDSMQRPAGDTQEVTKNNMPPSEKDKYDALKQDMNKLMASAEEEAEKGNLEGSRFKVTLAEEIKSKVTEMEEKYIVTYTVTHKGDDICDVCGTKFEALRANNHARHQAHFQGKVHLTYAKIRQWIKDLRSGSKDTRASRRTGGDRDREGERRRSRSRKEKRERSADRVRDRQSSRDGERQPERDRNRDRDRDRDRDRERQPDRDDGGRRRSRSRKEARERSRENDRDRSRK